MLVSHFLCSCFSLYFRLVQCPGNEEECCSLVCTKVTSRFGAGVRVLDMDALAYGVERKPLSKYGASFSFPSVRFGSYKEESHSSTHVLEAAETFTDIYTSGCELLSAAAVAMFSNGCGLVVCYLFNNHNKYDRYLPWMSWRIRDKRVCVCVLKGGSC